MELTSDFYKLAEEKLYSEVIEGKNLRQSDLYSRFFSAVRVNKEHADNLGEELIAICVHILSHMVGIKDGKLCVLTDDKGASGKIATPIAKSQHMHGIWFYVMSGGVMLKIVVMEIARIIQMF